MKTTTILPAERVKWKHNGHRFTVFKAAGSPFWYFAWREGGKFRKRSTFTRDREAAKKFAQDQWQHWLDVKAGRVAPEPEAAPKSMATIEELLKCYETGIARVSEKIDAATIAKNAGSLRRLLRYGGKVESGKWKVEILSAGLVDAAVTSYRAPAGSDARALDQRRRGAAAMVRQARAVFKPEALRLYREAGLVLPDLKSFLKERPVTAPARVHRSLDVGALRAMDGAVRRWRGELQGGRMKAEGGSDVSDLYLTHLCAKFLGLRASEIVAARRGWFVQAPDQTGDGRAWGQWFVDVAADGEFRPKASEGSVPVCRAVVEEFKLALRHRAPDAAGYLLAVSDREEMVYRTHSRWLRQFFPATDFGKTNHELRRWGSQVMEARYGKEAADAFLRHAPKTTAERHYLERTYPWSRLGNDVGITLEDARGPEAVAGGEQKWRRGL